MPVLIIRSKATEEQLLEMRSVYGDMIKVVVDLDRRILAGGGEMHADCEQELLEDGSQQEPLWGANWYPDDGSIVYTSLINIRPTHGNRSILVEDPDRCRAIEEIIRELLEQ